MKKLKIYLDTSILNFILADDAPKEKDITLKFFQQIDRYQPHISEVVVAEINRCREPKREQLLEMITRYELEELLFDKEAKELANKYVQHGIIPQKYQADAFHIAIASINNIDVLMSWNFDHMVKLKTKREVVGINLLMGYKEIDIYSPWEVVENV